MKPSKFDYKTIFFSDTSDYDDDIYFEHYEEHQMIKPIINNKASRSASSSSARFDIDFEMNRAYKKNESKIMSESIRPIGPGIYANYNSLNIIVGAQGKGKSHIVLRDIIQISRLKESNVHQIVYISKNGVINDSTFEAQRELINLPVKVVSDTNAEAYLKELGQGCNHLWPQMHGW